jgi:hypothetical protein
MTSILSRVAASRPSARSGSFRPGSPDDFFALRLAAKLGEAAQGQHYAALLETHSLGQLLTAYKRAARAMASGGSHLDGGRSFHHELSRLSGHQCQLPERRRLAAIRIERRAVAAVILFGTELAYPPLIRQLPSDNNKALGSAASFVTRLLEKCPFATAALEALPIEAESQRQMLQQIVQHVLSQEGVGICTVEKSESLAAFGYPPPRFRAQLRTAIDAMWPDINGSYGGPLLKDALALALYCQAEYLFNS